MVLGLSTLDGSSKTRYSVDDSSRPRISSKSVFINVAFASEDVRETVEYLQFDWYQVFGLSAAVAVFLDIGIRVYMFFVGRMISTLCGAAGEIIPEEQTQGLIGNEESEASLEERILGVDSDDDDL